MEDTMMVELNEEDATLLLHELDRHLSQMQDEVAHTDKRTLQHALGMEIDALMNIRHRIGKALLMEPGTWFRTPSHP